MKALDRKQQLSVAAVAVFLALGATAWTVVGAAEGGSDKAAQAKASAVKPALSVVTTLPGKAEWAVKLSANGSVTAWEEASIGAEVGGLRLTDVKVNVGDVVRRGQVLAAFSVTTVKADLAQTQAAVAEAEASLAEAQANAERARQLQSSGAISAQQINQYLTGERTAAARLESAKAVLANQKTRLEQTQLVAPEAGVISARAAAVGAVVPAGQELFRLIRDSRLEWRAEVTAAELARVKIGQGVHVSAPGGVEARGTVRMIAPTVDAKTRLALVYVDVPSNTGLKAGMFARGDFEVGRSNALWLPQAAVVLREGFSYVYRVGPDGKVVQTKVATGRRDADRIEILSGVGESTRVVASGAAFLADGDVVRVMDAAPPVPQSKSTLDTVTGKKSRRVS